MHSSPVSGLADPRRLRAVHATRLLDTGPEEAFDHLARLAATLLDVPHAFITVVDEQRSFWKSAIGVDHAAREHPVEESFCRYVIGGGRELIVADAADDARTRAIPSIEKLGVAAWAAYPFRAPGGETVGSFCVVDSSPREWTARDRLILETLSQSATAELALRAALVAERGARQEADTIAASAEALARTLQESLLPPRLPAVPGLQIAARYRPAGAGIEVVGDFYDVFQSGREAWNVVIGDVAGKGVEAAKMTALAHYTLRAAAMQTDTPSEALAVLNRAILEQPAATGPRFLTALYLSFTPAAGHIRMRICSGGHEPPILRRASGAATMLDVHGTLLGVVADPSLSDVTVELRPGDQIVLYTDGATDAKRGRERFGVRRLLDAIASAPADTADRLADAVDGAILAFNDGALPDDTALVVLAATS